jgi:hypothetical protein
MSCPTKGECMHFSGKRVSLAVVLYLGALAAPAGATDLIVNPGFTRDLSGWTIVNSSDSSAAWSPRDAFGVPGSGSVKATGSLGASQCFALAPGVLYDVSGEVYLTPGQPSDTFASPLAEYYTSSDCTTGPLGGNTMSHITAAGSWQLSSGLISLEPQEHSVAIGTFVYSPTATVPVSASFDNLYLAPAPTTSTCVKDSATLCLNNNRFQIRAHYTTPTASGDAVASALTTDTGFFTFFDPSNIEVVIKVLDACAPPFNQFWVFASGLTNVGVEIDVTDTQSTVARVYLNPLNTAFQPLQDTMAFPCP